MLFLFKGKQEAAREANAIFSCSLSRQFCKTLITLLIAK